MTGARVLVAGVGNVLLGDDGFGVEVVRRLLREELPPDVRVVDYGIRAVHLAYELLDGYDLVVLVDALSRGEAPGTVFVMEPKIEAGHAESARDGAPPAAVDPHGLHPAAVLAMASALGASLGVVRVVGCEPACVDEGLGLSPEVDRAVDGAVRLVREIVEPKKEEVTP